MRVWFSALVLGAILAPCALAQDSPRMKTVEPGNGKPGAELTVSGENLDAKFVKKVYLINGKDTEVQVTRQASDTLKFKIPADMKPGRYSIMVLTAEKTPKEIVQPVRCTVDQ